MFRFSPLFILLFLLAACSYFKQRDPRVPVARVNDSYLYEDDLEELVAQAASKEDSARLVNNFIDRWATQQLLIDQAKINLSQEDLDTYDQLVEQYKIDLYTEAYKSNIVARQLDSTISQQTMLSYYENNKDNFRLNDQLLKVRYVHVPPNYDDVRGVRQKLERFQWEDQVDLEELSLTFISFNFNDSTWVKKETLKKSIPVVIGAENQVLKKSNFTQLQDSLGVYLVKIEDVLNRNDVAPLSHVTPTIEQIILNKRKLELLQKLEKDITKDAIKDKKFETYPQN